MSRLCIVHEPGCGYSVFDMNSCRTKRGPYPTREEAEQQLQYAQECEAEVRQSQEATRRVLGCYYDPSD